MQGNQNVVGIYDQNVGNANNLNLQLKLELLNLHGTHSDQKPEMVFDQQGGVIGRGSDCDWVLRCTRRLISRRHAVISYLNGQYYIQDASSNGILLNDSTEALPTGMCTPLQEGDIFFVGDLSIGVSLFVTDNQIAQQAYEPHVIEPHAIDPVVIAEPDPVRHGQPHTPHMHLAQVADNEHDRIARQSAELGCPDDHFEPPKALIPDNWDLDVSAHSRTPADIVDRPTGSGYNEKRSALDGLLEGLGIPGKAIDQSLNPETMVTLGQCLRISIEGLARLREGHGKIESALLQENVVPNNDATENKISAVEPFINKCMSSDKSTVNELVSHLSADYSDLAGQQAAIIDCLGKVGGLVAEQFDPERIENAFKRYQAQQGKKRKWYRFFRQRDLKSTYHDFFKAYYKLRKRETERAIKCVFGQRFLIFYAGRLRGK